MSEPGATTRRSGPRHAETKSPSGAVLRVLQGVAICVTALAALALAAVVIGPRFLPYRALVVRSGSMSPTIPTGSVAFYREEQGSQVRVGQIVLFSEPGDPQILITHRVIRVEGTTAGRYLITKGDANRSPDAWRVPAAGVGWVVAYHVPYLGYGFAELSNPWAHVALVAVPAFALAFLLFLEMLRARRAPPDTQVA